jgi:hypothetical protein
MPVEDENEFGLMGILDRFFGIRRRPRLVDPYQVASPRVISGVGTPGVSSVDTGTTSFPGQPQEDPLDRLDRIARAMELGERVGAAFQGQPTELLTRGGGVAHPILPDPAQYGIRFLR